MFLLDDVHGAVIARITDENLWRVTYSEELSLPEAGIADGGFGLACGLFDAFALVDTLVAVMLDGAHDELVDRWAQERRRIFLDVASPAATQMKRTVYESDRREGEQIVERMRQTIAAPTASRERLLFPAKLRSAALIRA